MYFLPMHRIFTEKHLITHGRNMRALKNAGAMLPRKKRRIKWHGQR